MDSIELGALTTYEITDDGAGARLNFIDANGRAQCVYVPIENLKLLTLSMPKIVLEALRAQFHDPTLRLVHTVENWRVERASDGETNILTFTTPDHFAISFGIEDSCATVPWPFERRTADHERVASSDRALNPNRAEI